MDGRHPAATDERTQPVPARDQVTLRWRGGGVAWMGHAADDSRVS
jgi:hypothetical protein